MWGYGNAALCVGKKGLDEMFNEAVADTEKYVQRILLLSKLHHLFHRKCV